jgi:hypothetical protein
MQKWNIIGDAKVPTCAKGGMSTSHQKIVKTSIRTKAKCHALVDGRINWSNSLEGE